MTLARTCTVLVDLANPAGCPWEKPPFLAGHPEAIAETLRGHAREGNSHVQLVLDPNTRKSVEAVASILEYLDRG
jgi:hypothetical protein